MHVRRSFLTWGAFFLTVGAVALAVRGGYIRTDQVADWARFWPLLIVALGIRVLLSRTSLETVASLVLAIAFGWTAGAALSIDGFDGLGAGVCADATGGTPFPGQLGSIAGSNGRISVELDCGDLTMMTMDGPGWSVTGRSNDGHAPAIDASDAALGVHGPQGVFGGSQSWHVVIPRGPQLDLDVTLDAGRAAANLRGAQLTTASFTVNAGSATVDLGSASLTGPLEATLNAGSLAIALPPSGTRGSLTVNAGTLRLCAPDGVPLRIQTGQGLVSSYRLAGHGLVDMGDGTWQTPDFDGARTSIDLDVQANAGSVRLDPQEGCGV